MDVTLQLQEYIFKASTLAAAREQAIATVHQLYRAGNKAESQRLYALIVEKLYETYCLSRTFSA